MVRLILKVKKKGILKQIDKIDNFYWENWPLPKLSDLKLPKITENIM